MFVYYTTHTCGIQVNKLNFLSSNITLTLALSQTVREHTIPKTGNLDYKPLHQSKTVMLKEVVSATGVCVCVFSFIIFWSNCIGSWFNYIVLLICLRFNLCRVNNIEDPIFFT